MAVNKQSEICEILSGFLRAKVKFEQAYRSWRETGHFDFKIMDILETELYNLKNKTHQALRNPEEGNSGFVQKADLFDLIVGSIFHETLHLKEYIYTLTSYAPRYRAYADRKKRERIDSYTDSFLKHSMAIVNEAKTHLPEKANEVKNLFDDALLLLENIIKKYRNNSRIIRTIFTSVDTVEKIYGENGLQTLYSRIYKNGPPEGYLRVGASFTKDGFHDFALEAFESAAETLNKAVSPETVRQEILKKCHQLKKKHPASKEKVERLISKISF